LWQLAHDIAPLPDMRGSKKSDWPSSTRAGVLTLSCGIGTGGSFQALSAAVADGAQAVAGFVSAAHEEAARLHSAASSGMTFRTMVCVPFRPQGGLPF
jgi:hypothetical protein